MHYFFILIATLVLNNSLHENTVEKQNCIHFYRKVICDEDKLRFILAKIIMIKMTKKIIFYYNFQKPMNNLNFALKFMHILQLIVLWFQP